MAQPCAKSTEGLRSARKPMARRFKGATLTSRMISPPLDYGHRLFPGSSGRSWGHAQIEQTISVGPNVIHHEENEDGDRHDRPEQDFSLVFHVHEVEQSDQSLDRCEYQQNEEEMFGFGTLIRDEDFDPDYSEESHPDTHVRPHTRIVFRCARRHSAILPRAALVRVHQVHQRKYEHPDDINEVPIEAGGLDVVRVQPAPVVAPRDHGKCYYAGRDVQQVKPGDAEERGAKAPETPGRIVEEAPTIGEHMKPFAKVQSSEDNSKQDRKPNPLDRFVLVAGLVSTHCDRHR